MQQTIKLELSINEVNVILGGLAELPFKSSSDLIQKIRSESIAQLATPQAPAINTAPDTESE